MAQGTSSSRERLLSLLLRLSGGVLLLAMGAIFLPTGWMARLHASLGLGAFPAVPVVDYLTRSVAALYAMHGALYFLAAGDPRRFRPLIALIARMNIAFGLLVVGIGLHAGLPALWIASEGPPVVAFSLLLLWLLRGVPSD